MNLLLFQPGECSPDGQLEVSDRRLQHLRDVHRARAGDSVRVGEIGGRLGRGRILALEAERARIQVSLESDPPPRLPVTLVLALPRPNAPPVAQQSSGSNPCT